MGLRSLGYGLPGKKGDTGARGEKGDKGETGATGQTGATGVKGDVGDRGLPGAAGSKGDTGGQGPIGATGGVGPKGDAGSAGATGATGPAGPSGLTLIGNVTVTETLLISLGLGMKRMTLALSGVTTGARLLAVPNGTPSTGCEVVNAYPASNNNVSIGYYVPALGIGATYTIPVSVYRLS